MIFKKDMNVPKKPVFTAQELGMNPTIQALQIPTYEYISKVEFVTNPQDPKGPKIQKAIQLDATPKTSLFVTSAHRKLINQLSKSSKELFLWILCELESNKDYIWINKDRYMKECNINSYNTYKSALDGLISFTFLTPTIITGVYWINPSLYYRGSRINSFPNNILITNSPSDVDDVAKNYMNENI